MGAKCMARRIACWATVGAVGYLYWLGSKERPAMRQPSAVAVIDAPELTDAWARLSELPQLQYLRNQLLSRAVVGLVGARVLDVGCGLGQLTLALAACPEVREATGIDISPPLIEQARETSVVHGIDAHFLEMDVAEMPFDDDSFDVVVSSLSLHHWTRAEQALREIRRVLAPGGRAYILDLRRDAPAPMVGLLAVASHCLVPEPLRYTGEPLSSLKAAYTPVEAALLAAKAGWEDPRITNGLFWMVLETG